MPFENHGTQVGGNKRLKKKSGFVDIDNALALSREREI